MEIILKENVINLGYKDDIITVKDGYGRNFLIPTGKAILATSSAKKVLAENLKQRAHKLAQLKVQAEELAAKLEGLTLTLGVKASSTGKIFGSVTTIQIAEALEKQGIVVDKRIIAIKDVMKEVGTYKVSLKLHKEINSEITLEVVAE